MHEDSLGDNKNAHGDDIGREMAGGFALASLPPRGGDSKRGARPVIAAIIVAMPVTLFYGILFHQGMSAPFEDDYEALLEFLNRIVGLNGFSARFAYFFAAQFNEYKLFFGHGLVFLQLVILGRVDVAMLCALGNGFILLLGVLLWKMFLPGSGNTGRRLALFIPVPWLLFQLQYVETLNWAMPSLVNLPVVLFSLGAIYSLCRGTLAGFWKGLACLVLAIASSGNGLTMVFIGLLILASRRHYGRALTWLVVSSVCIAAYAYHYNVMSSQSRSDQSVLSIVIHPRPLYVVTFMGNALASPLFRRYFVLDIVICTLLGIVLCVFLFAMAKRGYVRRNPQVSYCVLFLLLTAVGVAGLRSDFGIAQSLNSRYGIYSALLLIFSWFAIVEEFLQDESLPLRKSRIWLGACAIAILFSLSMDTWGWRYLVERNQQIVLGVVAFEHSDPSAGGAGPVLPFPGQNWRYDELDRRAPEILRKSIALNIYHLPVY